MAKSDEKLEYKPSI